jgi:hypothetical protein
MTQLSLEENTVVLSGLLGGATLGRSIIKMVASTSLHVPGENSRYCLHLLDTTTIHMCRHFVEGVIFVPMFYH